MKLWAPHAWVGGRWEESVVLEAGTDGRWIAVQAGVEQPEGAERLAGPALPGFVNAHSHAFQRAFAGLAERRESVHDDFWSWRDRMYQVALRVDIDAMRAIAAQLYVELLRGGYTEVCEFHYLHHAPDGQRYAEPGAMAWALAEAARAAGIGFTLLPVLYERAGFEEQALRDDQRRFGTDPALVVALRDEARARGVRVGVAVHSLRAASCEAIAELVASVDEGPIHIHVAEQVAEVEACLAATGLRPVEWLTRNVALDASWQLVHATHVTPAEVEAVAATGAGVVLCPTTEANLGDGLTDLPGWLREGVPLAIGSDSHVGRDALEELRVLELGQRLARRERNVAADPTGEPSTAGRLVEEVRRGGAAAAGFDAWGLQAGARADLLVADPGVDALRGVPVAATLDALVFSGAAASWRDVMVEGRWVVRGGKHPAAAESAEAFESSMRRLWGDGTQVSGAG